VFIVLKGIKRSMRQQLAYKYGVESEEQAANYLRGMGFEVLFFRYKTPYGEVDLVVKKDTLLVFVEVKARNNPIHFDLITKKQIKRNCDAAIYFIGENEQYVNYDMRFDFITVINGRIADHIENAWECEPT
jgi:putative endonuclease